MKKPLDHYREWTQGSLVVQFHRMKQLRKAPRQNLRQLLIAHAQLDRAIDDLEQGTKRQQALVAYSKKWRGSDTGNATQSQTTLEKDALRLAGALPGISELPMAQRLMLKTPLETLERSIGEALEKLR